MGIEGWIKAASLAQLEDKVAEYEKIQQSWNGRDNELTHRLLVQLRTELKRRNA